MKIGDPICGEYGPRFVGYGRQRFYWRNWRGTAGVAAGIASLAFALMVLR